MNEQSIDAIFARFDVDFDVIIKRRERFDVVDAIVAKMTNEIKKFLDRSWYVIDLNIENFEVLFDEVDEINEVDKVNVKTVDEIVDEILFFSLWKFRFEATLTIFLFINFVWCWRTCSCNLFLESKIFSHCLQTTFWQTIWICCNKRVNDEKNAKQFKQEWYCDEKETDETKEEIWIEEFAKDFAENAMIKTSNHSLKHFLTISTSISHCCLYSINAESRKQSNNRFSKSDSRYWCWHCRNCCTKLAISQNRLNFWISHRRIASKKSISAATRKSFEISIIVFEISSFVVSNCKTSEHSNDF